MRPIAAHLLWAASRRSTDRDAGNGARLLQFARRATRRTPLAGRQITKLIAAGVLVCGGVTAPIAAAVDQPLPAAALVEHCRGFSDPKPSAGAPLCEAYLRGYLAGARSAGWLSIRSVDKPQETFTERAWRTRLGTSTQAPKPRSCVPGETTMPEFVADLLEYADGLASLENTAAQQLLEGMLRAAFPCGRVKQ